MLNTSKVNPRAKKRDENKEIEIFPSTRPSSDCEGMFDAVSFLFIFLMYCSFRPFGELLDVEFVFADGEIELKFI